MTGDIVKRVLFRTRADQHSARLRQLQLAGFSCRWNGPARKSPLTGNGYFDATRDVVEILECWNRWPEALIGTSGF
jgi:hypothetical protein